MTRLLQRALPGSAGTEPAVAGIHTNKLPKPDVAGLSTEKFPKPVVAGLHPDNLREPVGKRAEGSTPVATEAQSQPVDGVIRLLDVTLESGVHIASLEVCYRLEGSIDAARDNVVLVAHALTGDVRAGEWWKGVVGPHQALDTTKYAVLCPAIAGSPGVRRTDVEDDSSTAYTIRDQVNILARVLDALDIHSPRLVIGGSLGGMVTIEFAASFPERVNQAIAIAAPAAQTAQGIAWNAIMRRAIEVGGVSDGLALARMVGMLSYRTPEGLERRFGRTRNEDGRFNVESWLSAHGDRLVARYSGSHYLTLIDAMDTQDVGRGRGGIRKALEKASHRVTAVGIAGDLLYPAESVRDWAALCGIKYIEITSPHGHDAFLLETGRISSIIRKTLVSRPRSADPAQQSGTGKPASRKRPLRVALAGCGHVGGALLRILAQQAAAGERLVEIVRVLARDGERIRPALVEATACGITAYDRCITDPDRLLDGEIDVLVEAIGGIDTADHIIRSALRRGIRVVTANKALLALHGASLNALAVSHGTRIDFEASVGGAVPVVRCLRVGAAGVDVRSVSGILNGTTNFVLERLSLGSTFSEAVAEAQEHGYAEADPSRDLSGADAEDKLRVLAWLAFGVDPASIQVERRGLDEDVALLAREAAKTGDCVRLIASCTRNGKGIIARVVPERVSAKDAWAQVKGPANRIVVESASAGALVFHGAGAGGLATAGAILADVLA